MELLQGARHRTEQQFARDFISQFSFTILPLTENIGHRALIYVEEYALSDGMRAADAIVAATAVEANLKLLSGNARHLRPVKELQLRVFRPADVI